MPRTPEETFRLLLEELLAKDMDAVADLWAEDGIGEFPFVLDVQEIPAVTVHHTAAADTVVVEFTATGRTVRTGSAYRLDYVAVVTVQDGLITTYRDYWSPLATAAAAGTLPELLDVLRAEVAS